MREYNDETLTEDIRAFAQALLDDLVLGKIMCDAGVLRNLTLEEEKQLLDFAWRQPFMQRAIPPKDLGVEHAARPGYYGETRRYRIQHFNPFLGAAVARNVAAGAFASVNDPRVTAFIEKNKVPGDSSMKGDSDWQPRDLTFSEVYDLLKTIWSDPAVKAGVDHLNAMIRKSGSYDDREFVYPAMREIENIMARVMYNRGWGGLSYLLWYVVDLLRDQIDINDVSAVRARIAPTAHVRKISMEGAE